MSTVFYFEIRRKKQQMLKYIVFPVAFSLVLFAVCMVVEALFPSFNRMYMRWPDMVKDFLCLKPWSVDLWLNIWQLFALLYPFYLIYVMMAELSEALSEEERLETVVYLHNAGVAKRTIYVTKLFIWMGEAFSCCLSLLMLHVLFAVFLRQWQGVRNVLVYYAILFLVCMLYYSIAGFVAACRGKKTISADVLMAVLVFPWILSRIPAFMRFISELLAFTGREGAIVEQLGNVGERMEIFTILSPLTWCWPALTVQRSYFVCGIVLFVVMTGTAFSIYTHKKM